jgi:hypothetical protein
VLGELVDPPRGEPVAEHLRDLAGHRNRLLHREDRRDLHAVVHAPLLEVLVDHEGALERSGRAFERLPEHGDEHPAAAEVLQRVPQALGPGEGVVLVAAFAQARCGVEVVVRAHRHHEEVRVVGALVGGDSPRLGSMPITVSCRNSTPSLTMSA